MSIQYFKDPKADARSLMNKQKFMCNGEATGLKCRHYWASVLKIDAVNPDALRTGEKHRKCLRVPGVIIDLEGDNIPEMAVKCDQYDPSPFWARRSYDPDFEKYNPMTPEEIDAMRAADDDKTPTEEPTNV